jgi:hypothetical protein
MTGYLASITPPPHAFFALSPARTYWHEVAEIAGEAIVARCGAVGVVGVAVTASVLIEGQGLACPNCARATNQSKGY